MILCWWALTFLAIWDTVYIVTWWCLVLSLRWWKSKFSSHAAPLRREGAGTRCTTKPKKNVGFFLFNPLICGTSNLANFVNVHPCFSIQAVRLTVDVCSTKIINSLNMIGVEAHGKHYTTMTQCRENRPSLRCKRQDFLLSYDRESIKQLGGKSPVVKWTWGWYFQVNISV